LAGVGPAGFGPGSSFTSLGTITLLPVRGTTGKPASTADGSALAGVCGGGSPLVFAAHAESASAPAKITLIVFAIPPS